MSDSELYAVKRRVLDLERRMDALDGGVPPSTGPVKDAELQRLVRDGLLMQAIHRYRELNDAGLADAKAAVDAMVRD